jgi:hypothetical protein
LQPTATDTIGERRWDLANYADWLRNLSDGLLNEIDRHAEECQDEPTRELLRKIMQYVSINQNLATIQLLNLRLQMRENEKAIDEELYEISEHVSEILSVHLKEAENLRKIL